MPRSPRAPAAPVRSSARQLRMQAVERSRRAWRQLALTLPLLVAVVLVYVYRQDLFGVDVPVRIATVVVMVVVGWAFARQIGAALAPRLASRLDPGTAGVVGFLLRLAVMAAMLLAALRLAGLRPETLALGASFSAVVIGLAAQQTVGNMFAGIVLLSARPFAVGDRVRFAGFGMDVEGTVVAHGLLYVTCRDGADLVLVPNTTALTMSVRPIREPAGVDLRARLPPEVDPAIVEDRLRDTITVPTKASPDVALEEVDDDEVVVRIRAVPQRPDQGAALSREVLRSVGTLRSDDRRAA